MLFSIIVAVDKNNGIGINNKLPWKLKGDMEFFKNTTTKTKLPNETNVVIMGRKTYESIPQKFRPLPNRINIVISRNRSLNYNDGSIVLSSLDSAFDYVSGLPPRNIDKTFVIGGAEIYKQALKRDELHEVLLTRLNSSYNCDTFLHELDTELKTNLSLVCCINDFEDGIYYSINTYRKNNIK
jgi:dihydrofolate reductase